MIMLEINKKEFFENFNQGDIIGLDNLEKQLKSILAEVHDNMKANVKNEKIINKTEKINKKLKEHSNKMALVVSLINDLKNNFDNDIDIDEDRESNK